MGEEAIAELTEAHRRVIGAYLDPANAPSETVFSRAADALSAATALIAELEGERGATETRFWSIVDRDGLTGLPSDMWVALETLVNRAARATAAEARVGKMGEILKFDCTGFPSMEARAIHWANHISNEKGKPPRCPDPVILLEICWDIAKAGMVDAALQGEE